MDEFQWPELMSPARQERRNEQQTLFIKNRRASLMDALEHAVETIQGQEPERWQSPEKTEAVRAYNATSAAVIRDHIAWLREQPL